MEIKFAEMCDIDDILGVQEKAQQVLTNKEMLVTLSRDEITKNIQDNVLCICRIDGKIAAFRSMHIPDEDYLGRYIALQPSEKDKLIYSDITIVHPDNRGNGLQRKLGEWLFDRIDEKYTIIMATVHPDNIASIKDKFHHGMKLVAVDKVYGGKIRYIFAKVKDEQLLINEKYYKTIEDKKGISNMLSKGYIAINLQNDLLIFTQ
ncbi:GNAT family N-acetyltransferase [Macrococcoides canis]|uniref:GNAT family N-acetyltransferase n=1 Tax=Macrococcoides canis TaxID=1855823 RepID=UPI00207D0A52|nr:GNAT family protein [Macrococcus canis]MCO4096810.1 GNAT family N-acetyltransferase [Macrococcus canis]UTH06663.1 GNAT family N-acetyltransferase [Macrococcus canis]UTH09013.1 GNAT family N-acetyltransferase [Macrococcus canis]